MSTSTKSRKAKGRLFQKAVRDLFIRVGGSDPTGRLASEDIESRPMSQAGSDVIFRGERAQSLFPLYVECKQAKRGFNPHVFFSELAKKAKRNKQDPLLFHRRDRHESLVTMDERLFECLLEVWVRHFGGKGAR
jgi:hypothetical protein